MEVRLFPEKYGNIIFYLVIKDATKEMDFYKKSIWSKETI